MSSTTGPAVVCIEIESKKASLNSDILWEIIEHGCSDPASFLPKRTVVPALVFSQVCRSWRSFVLAQSTFWSSISWGRRPNEDEEDGLPMVDKRLLKLWDLYLSRSGQVLLDVSLFLYYEDESELREHVLDSVFDEQHRLNHLRVICEVYAKPQSKAHLLNSATQLTCLKLKIGEHDGTYKATWPEKCITVDLSNLTSLRELEAIGNVVLDQKMPVTTHELLRSVTYWTNSVIYRTTSTNARLPGLFRSLDLDYDNHTTMLVPTQELNLHLNLSHLRELSLGVDVSSAEATESLLTNSDIPALEELFIAFFGEADGVYKRRSWANGKVLESLKVLTLNWTQMGTQDPLFDEDLRRLLRCTPALKTLNIIADWISPQTFTLLTVRASEDFASNLCLALEVLSLRKNRPENRNISRQSVVDLVSSRWRPPPLLAEKREGPTEFSGLTDVLLCLSLIDSADGQTDICTIEPLRSLIKQGLRLKHSDCRA